MRLPDDVRAGVERVLGPLRDIRRVSGGCISPAARVETECGDVAFLKWAEDDQPADMFPKEARSLAALAAAGAVRVPRVTAADPDWLLLEWLEPAAPGPESWSRLGRELAALHRTRGHHFGWDEDNYIGPLPQPNTPAAWPEFWRTRRLEPQLERADHAGSFRAADRRRFDDLLEDLDTLLGPAEQDGPSLLHGDLWSGNVHATADGATALIDPASYFGHREVDLAMTELFGGFPADFYSAYAGEWPLLTGYRPRRRAVYQLYYLLVHVNLFGAAYVSRTLSALATAGF